MGTKGLVFTFIINAFILSRSLVYGMKIVLVMPLRTLATVHKSVDC